MRNLFKNSWKMEGEKMSECTCKNCVNEEHWALGCEEE